MEVFYVSDTVQRGWLLFLRGVNDKFDIAVFSVGATEGTADKDLHERLPVTHNWHEQL
jgi:hypothetical protein